MHGRQQHIMAHRMNGIAYPMQLKVRKAIHNLEERKMKEQLINQLANYKNYANLDNLTYHVYTSINQIINNLT